MHISWHFSEWRKTSKGSKMAELNALNAHLTASLLHFESLGGQEGERSIVIHNHYRRGILNIARAGIRRGGWRKWPRKAENGTRGELRLELKIARQRCRSVRNATSGIEIMAPRPWCLNIATRWKWLIILKLIEYHKRGNSLICEFMWHVKSRYCAY